ncbi:hypothetical protein ACFYV7_07305 [Nocardia suismassiliense]|uniref:Uncharacterized protein n=1 Tax=Nocardia suismassiliense TaxID=2077092 RepID=A0ABW6QMY9_9NOCA
MPAISWVHPHYAEEGKERIMVEAIVDGMVALFGVGVKAFLAAIGIIF